MLLSESIVVLVIACALHTMYSFWRRPTLRNAIVLGLLCGLAALGRNELLLLFPVVAIPLALRARDLEWRPRIRLAIVACVAGAVIVAPWVLFNLTRVQRADAHVVVASAACCRRRTATPSTTAVAIGYYDNCFHGPWPTGDESERDLVPRHQAIEYMKDHITRLPVVVLARVGRMWGLFKPGPDHVLRLVDRRPRASAVVDRAVRVLPADPVRGRRARRLCAAPDHRSCRLLAAPVILTIAAAVTFGVTRYRAPAEVSIVIAAAVGAVAAAGWLRAREPAANTVEAAPSPGTLANP